MWTICVTSRSNHERPYKREQEGDLTRGEDGVNMEKKSCDEAYIAGFENWENSHRLRKSNDAVLEVGKSKERFPPPPEAQRKHGSVDTLVSNPVKPTLNF